MAHQSRPPSLRRSAHRSMDPSSRFTRSLHPSPSHPSRHRRSVLGLRARIVGLAVGGLAVGLGACGSFLEPSASESHARQRAAASEPSLQEVLLVGNAVSGTVTFVDGRTWEPLGEVNVLPDLQERLDDIHHNPIRAAAYAIVRHNQKLEHFEPHDGDRFVDDVFTSPDGSTLYVSRANLGDVAAFDLTRPGQPLLWRVPVEGYKADHATLSPDGSRIVVSATTVDRANVIDTATGTLVGTFQTGHFPHQNDYSADGRFVYNGSIGNVSTSEIADVLQARSWGVLFPQAYQYLYGVPTEDETMPSLLNFAKGRRLLTRVDARTFEVNRVYAFDQGIRPAAFTRDGRTMYAQLSYLNGLIEYDLGEGKEVGRLVQPFSEFAKATYKSRHEFPHDSAHHGLALSGDESTLCDAGTIDDTVTLVSTHPLAVKATIPVGHVPYWATQSGDGHHCLVSLSGEDSVWVVDFASGSVVTKIPVGRFPQRNRLGQIRTATVSELPRPH